MALSVNALAAAIAVHRALLERAVVTGPQGLAEASAIDTLAVATAVVLAIAAGSRSADDGKEHEERLVHRVDSA